MEKEEAVTMMLSRGCGCDEGDRGCSSGGIQQVAGMTEVTAKAVAAAVLRGCRYDRGNSKGGSHGVLRSCTHDLGDSKEGGHGAIFADIMEVT